MSPLQIALLIVLSQMAPPSPPAPSKPAAAPALAAPTGPVQFTLGMKPGEARLIEIEGKTSGDVSITVGKNKVDSRKRTTTSYRVVDSMVEPGDKAWTGWRRYVKAQATDDGEISDPELTGLEADVSCSKESEVEFKIRGGRSVAKSHIDRLIAGVGCFGLHVDLPAELAPGKECEVDFAALAQWCFDLSGKATSAKAHLKLAGIDPKGNIARLAGDVKVEEKVDESAADSSDGVASKATGRYEGTVEIDYDQAAKRVVRVACKGKGHIEGDVLMIPPAHLVAESTHEATLTSVDGPPVAAALKTKPQTRDVPHSIQACGIVVTLPSHFFKIHLADDPVPRFISMLEGEARQANVRVVDLPAPGVALKDESAAFLKSLTDSNPGVKVTESAATSGLGAGRAFDFTTNDVHSVSNLLTVADGHFVVVQFIAPESVWPSHKQEFAHILQSLKRIPARK